MRAFPFFLILSLATASVAQSRQGVYRPKDAPAAPWSINQHHTLIWNGAPYLPVGLNIEGAPATIAKVQGAGIRDVVVNLPANGSGWVSAFEALDKGESRYLLSINSLAPMAEGVAVQPQSYRQTGITAPTKIDWSIPGATYALTVLVTKRDSAIEKVERVPIVDGRFKMDVKPGNDLDHVLMVYPFMSSLELPDFWSNFDRHRDTLLASLRNNPPGPGLRGIVNPLGSVLKLQGEDRFVPNNQIFRYELAKLLENKYKSIATLNRGWGITASDLTTYEDIARLVPLWSGNRGVAQFWDPQTDKLYKTDSKKSTAWTDIDMTILEAGSRRLQRLATSIQQVTNVPVIQDWAGWAAPYNSSIPSVDGIGVHTSGETAQEAFLGAARASSTILQWNGPGWLLASQIDLTKNVDPALELGDILNTLISVGCRGAFIKTKDDSLWKLVSFEANGRSNDVSPAQYSPKPLYFPERAMNPAMPSQLPNGWWWLPGPFPGERIDMGSHYYGYRCIGPDGEYFVLWTFDGAHRAKLRIPDPKTVTFQAVDGSDPKPRILKGGFVEVTLTNMPLIVRGIPEAPIPDGAVIDTVTQFDAIIEDEEAAHIDSTSERFYFKKGQDSLERSPATSFALMRASYYKVAQRRGQFFVIEGESSKVTNFSDTTPTPGASGETALALDTPFSGSYFAEYTFPSKSRGAYELWIGAKLSAKDREALDLKLNGESLKLNPISVGAYSDGFAWYRIGPISLAGTPKFRIEVVADGITNFAIDALLLAPPGFVPSGLKMPETPPAPPKKKPM